MSRRSYLRRVASSALSASPALFPIRQASPEEARPQTVAPPPVVRPSPALADAQEVGPPVDTPHAEARDRAVPTAASAAAPARPATKQQATEAPRSTLTTMPPPTRIDAPASFELTDAPRVEAGRIAEQPHAGTVSPMLPFDSMVSPVLPFDDMPPPAVAGPRPVSDSFVSTPPGKSTTSVKPMATEISPPPVAAGSFLAAQEVEIPAPASPQLRSPQVPVSLQLLPEPETAARPEHVPIEVRIGTIEVRSAAPAAPAPVQPPQPAPSKHSAAAFPRSYSWRYGIAQA
jgi:hypothetical protein